MHSTEVAQNFFSVATKVATDALKTASKRAIQKTAGATGDLIDNKIADAVATTTIRLQRRTTKCHINYFTNK